MIFVDSENWIMGIRQISDWFQKAFGPFDSDGYKYYYTIFEMEKEK